MFDLVKKKKSLTSHDIFQSRNTKSQEISIIKTLYDVHLVHAI